MISGLPPIFSIAPDATPEAKKAVFDRVAKSFEAVFVSQLVRGLRESFCKDLWGGGGFGKEIYASWFDQALAEAVAGAGGLGVKEQLQRFVFPTETNSSHGAVEPKEAHGLRSGGTFKVYGVTNR